MHYARITLKVLSWCCFKMSRGVSPVLVAAQLRGF